MSKKGGYKIVSLGGLDLLDENLSLKGLYDALKVSYDKPILLTGIVIDGEKKKDALVQANEGANKIIIKNLYGYDLEVAKSGDAITVSESPDGIELPIPTPEDDEKIVGVNVQGKYVLKPSVKEQVESASSGTIQDVLGLDSGGKLVKGAISGGTKFYKHSIVISKSASIKTFSIDTSTGTSSIADSTQTMTSITLINTRAEKYTELTAATLIDRECIYRNYGFAGGGYNLAIINISGSKLKANTPALLNYDQSKFETSHISMDIPTVTSDTVTEL